MIRQAARIALVAASAWLALSVSCALARPFSVHDAIEAGVVQTFDNGEVALYSPDWRHVVIHVRRGDLADGAMVDALYVIAATDIVRLLQSGVEQPPFPEVSPLVERRAQQDWNRLRHVRWLNNREIGFLGEADNGLSQAFSVTVANRRTRQLTHARGRVASFAINNGVTLFYEHAQPPAPVVRPLGAEPIVRLIAQSGDPTDQPAALMRGLRGGQTPVHAELRTLASWNDQIWLSPSGRYAIVLAPSLSTPAHWSRYRVPEEFAFSAANQITEGETAEAALRPRYQLIDMQTLEARPLLDAPSGLITFNRTKPAVFWSDDENYAVVTNTFLPLTSVDDLEARSRSARPAIAEVRLDTGAVTRIHEEWGFDEEQSDYIASAGWSAETQSLRLERRDRQGGVSFVSYTRGRDGWSPAAFSGANGDATPRIEVRQSLNERPRLFAVGGACACARVLFDPAPALADVNFGQTRLFEWTDAAGVAWRGGLLLPPDYDASRRYPLIIQTHGFDPNRFLMMGFNDASTDQSAFAAQPLAAAGFVVLQAGEPQELITADEREGPAIAQGWRAAIDRLAADHIIDPERVGVIGFSRTGFHLVHFLALYPNAARAALISDAFQPGYFQRTLAVNAHPLALADALSSDGPGPESIGYGAYFERNALYRMGASNAAVRIEAMGPGSAIAMAETYAVLRNRQAPVEFVFYPRGAHNLAKPHERLESQNGALGWFSYWIVDAENGDRRAKATFIAHDVPPLLIHATRQTKRK